MSRDVDERKKRKALRKLRKAAALAEQGLGPPLSDWEKQFLEEVEARIETYGSAFADPEKGGRDDALSALQAMKLREIDKKARGKSSATAKRRSGFKNKAPDYRPNVRQLDEEENIPDPPAKTAPAGPRLVETRESGPEKTQPGPPKPKPNFRVIEGGNK